MLLPPLPADEAKNKELVKGPNIVSLPRLDPIPDRLEVPILLKVGDDISTDEILPAGSRILPFRSNIPRISEFTFEIVDPGYAERAKAVREETGHAVLGGENYGQGSSREHAALAPRHLGLRLVIAKGFARIHLQNLINFGVLPVTLADPAAHEDLEQGDVLQVEGIRDAARKGKATLPVKVKDKDVTFDVNLDLTQRECEVLLAGGVTNWIREKQ